MNKVVVVGTGNVGVKYAAALISRNSNIDELILVDINKEKSMGEAMDLSNTLYALGSKTKIKAGTYLDAKDAKIVVIAAGVNQNKNETRLDLVKKNSKIIKDITLNIIKSGFNGIFLVASNPVDIITYLVKNDYKHLNTATVDFEFFDDEGNLIDGDKSIISNIPLGESIQSTKLFNCDSIYIKIIPH